MPVATWCRLELFFVIIASTHLENLLSIRDKSHSAIHLVAVPPPAIRTSSDIRQDNPPARNSDATPPPLLIPHLRPVRLLLLLGCLAARYCCCCPVLSVSLPRRAPVPEPRHLIQLDGAAITAISCDRQRVPSPVNRRPHD